MKVKPAITRVTLAAGIASLVGPGCAVLPYTDYVVFLPTASLTVWLLAGIGAIGVGIGVFALGKGNKIAGTICLLTNIPVLAYWGFIAFFTAMGGGA
jgi:hypothetical protein